MLNPDTRKSLTLEYDCCGFAPALVLYVFVAGSTESHSGYDPIRMNVDRPLASSKSFPKTLASACASPSVSRKSKVNGVPCVLK